MIADIWAIGIDLGATKAGIAQVDCLGNIHKKVKVPTGNSKSAEEVIADISEAIKGLINEHSLPPVGIGVGIAGQIDPEIILVHNAPNLEWQNFPIGKELKSHLHLPVAISNDVHAATRGEWMFGAGHGCKDLVCVFVGTGIGGGIVSHGKMLAGHSNTIGEVGHMTVNFNGPTCACGNTGCLEAYAGGASLGKRAEEALLETPDEVLKKLSEGNKITGKMVQEAAEQGSKVAQQVLDQALEALISGSVSIVNALNPQLLIFGGGVIEGMPSFVQSIRRGVEDRALKAATVDLEIKRGKLHNDAGIIGSAALAIEKFGS